jgi:multimeric flavodoxin WrbA
LLQDLEVQLRFAERRSACGPAESVQVKYRGPVDLKPFECGTPYGENPQILVTDGIGGSPYGPGTLAGTDGSRQPVEAELTTARNLGSRLARVAGRLKDLRVPQ